MWNEGVFLTHFPNSIPSFTLQSVHGSGKVGGAGYNRFETCRAKHAASVDKFEVWITVYKGIQSLLIDETGGRGLWIERWNETYKQVVYITAI